MSRADGWASRISGFVSRHPIATAIGVACVAGGVWLASEVLVPDNVFKPEDTAEEEEEEAKLDAQGGQERAKAVEAVAAAVHKAGVYNRFTRSELLGLYNDWVQEFKSSSLTLVQFTKVFHTMGVHDDRVIRSMFEAWDRDRDGSVDFSELLNAIAITGGGSLEDKLTLCFRAFDLNGDGSVAPAELAHFFKATRAALGKKVVASDIDRRVAQVFTICDANGDGYITEEEFRSAAMRNSFFKPGGLFTDFEEAMKRFLTR